PMMACVGNVTEFIAADPVGINALLNCIAVELGIQLLLVTDVSVKCRGGIKEVHKGRNLAYIAKTKNAPPKDHGIDLLLAKSRYGNDIPIATQLDIQAKHLQTNDPKKAYHKKVEFDPKGSFMIWLNYFEKLIHLVHLTSEDNKPDLYLTASHAKPLFEEILSRNLLSRLDHAYYLGRELERAEICLYLGKTYVQDEQVFQDK
ncbi:MAG: DUF4346 domain-containing protein, partial [Asgard group archaeon]|nr:DUF4346 domain-containing protein [Asgard group archaeon]